MNQPAYNPSADGRSIAGREATARICLDSLPAEALCEGGSRIYKSTILRQGYGWQVRSSVSFTTFPRRNAVGPSAEAADKYGKPNTEHRTPGE